MEHYNGKPYLKFSLSKKLNTNVSEFGGIVYLSRDDFNFSFLEKKIYYVPLNGLYSSNYESIFNKNYIPTDNLIWMVTNRMNAAIYHDKNIGFLTNKEKFYQALHEFAADQYIKESLASQYF